jgi:hypothetical protein
MPEGRNRAADARAGNLVRLRQFPKPRQPAALGRPLPNQQLSGFSNYQELFLHLRRTVPWSQQRQLILFSQLMSPALPVERTFHAFRLLGQANRGPQLHQALIEIAGMPGIDQRIRDRLEPPADNAGSHVSRFTC